MWRSARVPSSVLPDATRSTLSGSSLIVIDTSPWATSLRLAASRIATSESVTAVNIATPRDDFAHCAVDLCASELECPENIMNAIDIRPAVTNVMPSPLSPAGTSE